LLHLPFFSLLFIVSESVDDPFCMEVGWRLRGEEYRTIQGIDDPRDCQQECQYDDFCLYFRYRGSRQCELLFETTGEWEFSITTVSGPKTCYLPPSDFPEMANSACKVVGLQIEGDDYESVRNGEDNTACQMMCNRDPRCAYWSWEAPTSLSEQDQRCHLYDSAAAISGYDTSIRYVSGPKKCPSVELSRRFPVWRSRKMGDYFRELPWPKEPVNGRRHLPHCVEWRKQISETPAAAYRVADWRDCKSLCAMLPACGGWNWHAAGTLAERCDLFPTSPTGGALATAVSPLTVTGPRECEDPLFDFPEYSQVACAKWGVRTQGTVLTSMTMQPTAVPEDCMTTCQETAGCVSYTFSVANRQCALLSTDEGYESEPGVLSGPAMCLGRPEHYEVHMAMTRSYGFASSLEPLPLVPVVPVASPSYMPTLTAARAAQGRVEEEEGETILTDCGVGVPCEEAEIEVMTEEAADDGGKEESVDTMEETATSSASSSVPVAETDTETQEEGEAEIEKSQSGTVSGVPVSESSSQRQEEEVGEGTMSGRGTVGSLRTRR